jgi:malate dehydrogenase (oxaloacetate-decarboxylating)
MLLAAGVCDLVGCDRAGALYAGRPGLTPEKVASAEQTNPRGLRCSADEALAGADVHIGVSAPGAVTFAGIGTMAERAIVFAMANPIPEVLPEEIMDTAEVIATGRSDYSNQINNVLAFPVAPAVARAVAEAADQAGVARRSRHERGVELAELRR